LKIWLELFERRGRSLDQLRYHEVEDESRRIVRRKLSTFILLASCLFTAEAALWAQDQPRNSASTHEIRGYLDPETGVFRTAPHPEQKDGAEPAATATYTGKIVVNFTITVDSTIAATTKIGCNVSADVDDEGTGNFISESAGSAVLRGTGTSVTCAVNIPYSWKLGTPAIDVIGLNWTITSPVAITTGAAAYPIRVSSQSLPAFKVPVSGTPTTETVAATI
jgi:hypothetical protein